MENMEKKQTLLPEWGDNRPSLDSPDLWCCPEVGKRSDDPQTNWSNYIK